MVFRFLSFLILLIFSQTISGQQNLTVIAIPENLQENANAVIRLDETDITISSRKSMNIKKKRVVTVINEYGLTYLNASEHFDNATSVKSVEAVVYDEYGKEIKKIRRKDFKEYALADGTFVSDSRILVYSYTPVTYPFTFVYTSEIQTSNTAFIPSWSPVEGFYAPVEKSVLNIKYDPELGFRYKEYNHDKLKFNKQESAGSISFTAENIKALKKEDYLPSLHKISPHVLFALQKFNLEGVDGEVTDWKSFGTWMYTKLLEGTDELPEPAIAAIKVKVGNETDPIKKAKIVYEYVQGKTRYISIQLGIGGWKPMLAKDVDRLGYGDCKALTNYTRALLKAVGVASYYTVVYGDPHRRDILSDFTSMQGNHVILAIPHNNDYVWLECTSQTSPFGFTGRFTDNRYALIIKPDGGEIIKTSSFNADDSSQYTSGNYSISETGSLSGAVTIRSKGIQYDDRYYLETRPAQELDKYYKNKLGHMNSLKLNKINLVNNKAEQEFTEELNVIAESYCNKNGNRLIFVLNAFSPANNIPQRYRNRTNPFEIEAGFIDTDEIAINLPTGYSIEARPESISFKDKFGEYSAEYLYTENNKMIYKRKFKLYNGFYNSEDYENYRLFREKVARNDNAKIVLVKN